jgi:hypothetical protein
VEPHVDFFWLDIDQVFPSDDARWRQCAIQVPPCGQDERFKTTMSLRLAALIMASATPADDVPGGHTSASEELGAGDLVHYAGWPQVADAVIKASLATDAPQDVLQAALQAALTTLEVDLLSTSYSLYGVLYVCLLNSSLFQTSQDTLYTLYRKDPAHPFPCRDGPALLHELDSRLLDHEQDMTRMADQMRTEYLAWEDAKRMFDFRAQTYVSLLDRQKRTAPGGNRARKQYADLQKRIQDMDRDYSVHIEHCNTQYRNDCRLELTRFLHEAFLRHGPFHPHFQGKPLYYAIATILTSFDLASTTSVARVAETTERYLRRIGLLKPTRKPRTPRA